MRRLFPFLWVLLAILLPVSLWFLSGFEKLEPSWGRVSIIANIVQILGVFALFFLAYELNQMRQAQKRQKWEALAWAGNLMSQEEFGQDSREAYKSRILMLAMLSDAVDEEYLDFDKFMKLNSVKAYGVAVADDSMWQAFLLSPESQKAKVPQFLERIAQWHEEHISKEP